MWVWIARIRNTIFAELCDALRCFLAYCNIVTWILSAFERKISRVKRTIVNSLNFDVKYLCIAFVVISVFAHTRVCLWVYLIVYLLENGKRGRVTCRESHAVAEGQRPECHAHQKWPWSWDRRFHYGWGTSWMHSANIHTKHQSIWISGVLCVYVFSLFIICLSSALRIFKIWISPLQILGCNVCIIYYTLFELLSHPIHFAVKKSKSMKSVWNQYEMDMRVTENRSSVKDFLVHMHWIILAHRDIFGLQGAFTVDSYQYQNLDISASAPVIRARLSADFHLVTCHIRPKCIKNNIDHVHVFKDTYICICSQVYTYTCKNMLINQNTRWPNMKKIYQLSNDLNKRLFLSIQTHSYPGFPGLVPSLHDTFINTNVHNDSSLWAGGHFCEGHIDCTGCAYQKREALILRKSIVISPPEIGSAILRSRMHRVFWRHYHYLCFFGVLRIFW